MRFLAALLALAAPLLPQRAEAYQEQSLCVFLSGGDTDDQQYIAWPHKGYWEITDLTFAPATAVAAHNDNHHTFLVSINAGVASTSWSTIGTWSTDADATPAGIAHVVGTVVDVTVLKPSTIQRGYQIRFQNTNGGTGPAFDGTLCVNARKVR